MNWDQYLELKKQRLKDITAKRTQKDRDNNWERQATYKKQKETCECGFALSKGEMYRHVKLRRHLRKMEEKLAMEAERAEEVVS